jgi:EmrB/QacA subfamily drug resistance transporter
MNPPDPKRWAALGVMLLAAVMDLVDATIVNVAIPSLQSDLDATASQIEWIVASYALAFSVGLITGGRLGDVYGRRRVFLVGVAGFTVASLACGLAPSAEVLIGARVAQGAFAALMVPQVLSMIQVLFPPEERAKAFGMYGACIGLGAVGGPLIGGALVELDIAGLGWRPIFLINIPIGVIAFVLSRRLVRESKAENKPGLDLVGVALVSTALLLLVYPLVQGHGEGWPAWTFVAIALSIPAFALFAWQQGRRERRGGFPLVPLHLFKERAFTAGVLVSLLFLGGIAVFFLMLSISLQQGLGWSPLHLVAATITFPLGIVSASGLSINLAAKAGRTLTFAGAALMACGMAMLALIIDDGVTTWELLGPMFVCGFGMGLVAPILIDLVLAGVPESDAGSASGVLNTSFQLGGAIGIAAIGAVFFEWVPDQGLIGALTDTLWILVGLNIVSAAAMTLLPHAAEPHGTEMTPA